MFNYDEVYAILTEYNLEDHITDLESNQLMGEAAFVLDGLMKKYGGVNDKQGHQNIKVNHSKCNKSNTDMKYIKNQMRR